MTFAIPILGPLCAKYLTADLIWSDLSWLSWSRLEEEIIILRILNIMGSHHDNSLFLCHSLLCCSILYNSNDTFTVFISSCLCKIVLIIFDVASLLICYDCLIDSLLWWTKLWFGCQSTTVPGLISLFHAAHSHTALESNRFSLCFFYVSASELAFSPCLG